MDARLGNQIRTFERLLAAVRPYFRSDRNLPARIQKLLTSERRFGSRDRRLYRELFYTTLRFLPWFEEIAERSPTQAVEAMIWLASPLRATAALQSELILSLGPVPKTIGGKAARLRVDAELLPDWLNAECPQATIFPNLEVLHTRAPLWLRLQTTNSDSVFKEFEERGWAWRRSEVLSEAVEMIGEVDVTATDAFAQGKVEVQDLGSQLVLAIAGVARGERWLDACAGAGGKTLQLAQVVGPDVKVTAHDIRPEALSELAERARRAGVGNVEISPQIVGSFDAVLVDAPCSGTGTWRRSPHLKNCTRCEDVASMAELQLRLLTQFSAHVRLGGRLIYATCSLCRSENADVVENFLAQQPSFAPIDPERDFGFPREGAGRAILPAGYDTDGFFVAILGRK